MASIKLGNRPKTFKPITVKAELPDGTEGSLTVTFKYMTKTESGKLFDEMVAAAKASGNTIEGTDAASFSMEQIMGQTRDRNAQYMLGVIDSWSIDEDVSLENLQQLDDEAPAVIAAVMDAFRSAAHTGKLGN